jgi:hypothetical protein
VPVFDVQRDLHRLDFESKALVDRVDRQCAYGEDQSEGGETTPQEIMLGRTPPQQQRQLVQEDKYGCRDRSQTLQNVPH